MLVLQGPQKWPRWSYESQNKDVDMRCVREQGQDMNQADSIQVGGTHYKDMAVQPWEVMQATMTHEEFVGFLKGNIYKYALRAGKKDGSVDDAAKCRHYMQKLAEVEGDLACKW